MPFGLCNAPSTFQRWIIGTLNRYVDRCCIVYLDYVLAYSGDLEQYQKDVESILQAIAESGVKLKPSKCEFHQQEGEYLGFIVNCTGIRTDPTKTEALELWKAPRR